MALWYRTKGQWFPSPLSDIVRARGTQAAGPCRQQRSCLNARLCVMTHSQTKRRPSMHVTRRQTTLGGLSLLASMAMRTTSLAHVGDFLGLGEGLEDFWLTTDAYIYGYPLVTMEYTRRIMTNVAAPEGNRGPMAQFIKARQYPDASFRDVTAPNADTLYTTAWVDLGKEPWVMSIPDMKDRYFLMPMLDGWTNVFQVPGKRTTGTKAKTYALTGPGWKGTLPAGVRELKSPTDMVWILGRIYCTGTPEDYKAVHEAQDAFTLA